MCLSLEMERPNDVLGRGEHEGFQWRVMHNGAGFRCGYVRVPKGHPWFKKGRPGDPFIPIEIHGGITFAEPDVPCGKGEDDGWWIGFDCAHFGDAPDPELIKNIPSGMFLALKGTVRSQKYVEKECKRLCEQAKHAVHC